MSTLIPILFIIMAVSLIVGPIMMVRPSESQKKLALLRKLANEVGMSVSSAEVSSDSSTRGLMRYVLMHKKTMSDLKTWALVKRPIDHELHFLGRWDWVTQQFWDTNELHLKRLREIIEQFPNDIVYVGVSELGVEVQWRERTKSGEEQNTIETLKSFLLEIKSLCIPDVHVERS